MNTKPFDETKANRRAAGSADSSGGQFAHSHRPPDDTVDLAPSPRKEHPGLVDPGAPIPPVPQSLQKLNVDLDHVTEDYLDIALQDATYSAMDGYVDADPDDLNLDNLGDGVETEYKRYVAQFLIDNEKDIAEALNHPNYNSEQLAADLYTETVGSGVGFRDRNLGDVGKRLAENTPRFDMNAGLGEDGKVYFD